MISAGLRLQEEWWPVELYVDSGATYTILRTRVAEDADFDYQRGRKVHAQVGDGSLIPVFLHDLPLQIGPMRFKATIGFSEKLGVSFNLLGRLGVFDRFKVCFREKRRVLTFQPEG